MNWQTPPLDLTLSTTDIHVWQARLEWSATERARFWAVLSNDEKMRAERFHFERDRHHFVAARGILRMLLGRYLQQSPSSLVFDYSARGKPHLASSNPFRIQFNLSHSHALALYGFAQNVSIGVDLEFLRPISDAQAIAQRFFTAGESAKLQHLPKAEQRLAFFRGWTRKEAYLKATGEGLAGSLSAVEVTLLASEPVQLLSIPSNRQAITDWFLWECQPAREYVGALAIQLKSIAPHDPPLELSRSQLTTWAFSPSR